MAVLLIQHVLASKVIEHYSRLAFFCRLIWIQLIPLFILCQPYLATLSFAVIKRDLGSIVN